MRLIPSKPWIKSNTLPLTMPLRLFFEASAWLGPVRVKNGQYMNLQRLDSSIQGSLGEAEQLTMAIKFEVAYIRDILPTMTMLGQTTST